MTPDEAHGLLDPGLSRPVSDELYRLSGGNPFYLGELARAARRGAGDAVGSAAATGAARIPAAVQGALAEEVAVLSPRAHALIQGAAVAGDPFEVGLAAAVGDGPEGEGLAALDELLDGRPGSAEPDPPPLRVPPPSGAPRRLRGRPGPGGGSAPTPVPRPPSPPRARAWGPAPTTSNARRVPATSRRVGC